MGRLLLSAGLMMLLLLGGTVISYGADSSLEKELVKAIRRSSQLIDKARNLSHQGKSPSDELKKLKKHAEEIQAIHLLLNDRLEVQGQMARQLGKKASERQEAWAGRYRAVFDELLPLLYRLNSSEDISQTLDVLKVVFEKFDTKTSNPILGALPYRKLAYPVQPPVYVPQIIPAYKSISAGSTADDLQSSPEATLSPVIVELAQSLNWSPVEIYEWVKNNIETEWYWGSMKGAEETLKQGSGNDADQASLLIALLRASGYPARYVRGVIEFFPEDMTKLANLAGVEGPENIGELFRKAGISYEKTLSGSEIVNYRIEHIWVETEIPYSNYRGIVSDEQGKVWLPLDTSIKVAGYAETSSPVDFYSEVGNPVPMLRSNYLGTSQLQLPMELLKSETQSYLDQYHPGVFYEALLSNKVQNGESLHILPSSLQFFEVAVTGEYTTLPTQLLHSVRFLVPGPGSDPVLAIRMNVFELSNRQVILGFEPETIEDQEIINSFGGLDNTPGYLVRLRPVLLINGKRKIVGQSGFASGEELSLTLEVVSPVGTETIENRLIAGYPTALGIVSQQALPPSPEDIDATASDILHAQALLYLEAWNQAESELASLLQLELVRPIPSLVTIGGALEVSTLLGVPQGFEWKGVFCDADLRVTEPVSRLLTEDDRERAFMELSALQGSVLENRVFEDAFGGPAVSTAKLFGLANDSQVPILTIDDATIDTFLPGLPFADNIKADISDAVLQGQVVRIPASEIGLDAWTGVGYIKEDPLTGEAGYMLSGEIAGGMTTLSPFDWVYSLVYALQKPNAQPPNTDPAAAASLKKLPGTDYLSGTVGQELMTPLQVLVRDESGVPVQGAPVLFAVTSGGGILSDPSQELPQTGESLTVFTDASGIASAYLTLGQQTGLNPVSYAPQGATYPYIAGENAVSATLVSDVLQTNSFVAYGLPDKPVTMTSLTGGSGTWGDILSYSSDLHLVVRDQYLNPVANVPIDLEALPAVYYSTCEPADYPQSSQSAQLSVEPSCMQKSPAWGECGSVAASSIQGKTLSDGTLVVGVILGGVPYAEYPISATYRPSEDPAENLSLSFQSYTREINAEPGDLNVCGGQAPPANTLKLQTYENVVARPADVPLPIRVKAYLLGEGETTGQESLSCGAETPSCTQILGDYQFGVSRPNDLAVTIDGMYAVYNPSAGANVYEVTSVLGVGTNDIRIDAAASKGSRSYGNSCSGCAAQATDIMLNLSATKTLQLIGVKVKTPSAIVVNVDEDGFALQGAQFSYSILPATYAADFAQVLLYKGDRLLSAVPAATTGTGSFTIPQGFWFDPNSEYSAQVILDYSWEDEIRSPRVPILPTSDMVDLFVEGLPRAVEDQVGAFVLLNNDFDEGNVDQEGLPLPDSTLSVDRIVPDDDEIKRAQLVLDGQGVVSEGAWMLQVSDSSKIKIYVEDGLGGFDPVPPGVPRSVTLPATVPLYIEGVSESTAILSDWITAVFTPTGLNSVEDSVPVTVTEFDMAVDGNRDRFIKFEVLEDESYLFWVNNDSEDCSWLSGEEEDAETGNDSLDDEISCKRDLEDFARLHLFTGSNLPKGALTYHLRMEKNAGTEFTPKINLFAAVDPSEKYLGIGTPPFTQPDEQLLVNRLAAIGTTEAAIPAELVEPGVVSAFLFEGRENGQGRIILTARYNGVPVLERSVGLELWDMSYFYDHYVVGTGLIEENGFSKPIVNPVVNPVGTGGSNSHEGLYQGGTDEYVLYVHGWNMEPWVKKRWAETTFKRLWWQGYQGRVGLYDWPCETFAILPAPLNFDLSEHKAWQSGEALKSLLEDLNGRHPGAIRVLAHSQANVVASEALYLGDPGLVHTYVASQAALSASFFRTGNTAYEINWGILSPETPDVMNLYPGYSPPSAYLKDLNLKGTRLISYFNEEDYALTTAGPLSPAWEYNNRTKPDDTGGYRYIGSIDSYPNPPLAGEGFIRGTWDSETSEFQLKEELRFPGNRYEIFAHGAESREKAFGAVPFLSGEMGGFLDTSLDFDNWGSRNLKLQFGFNNKHYSHSRQFNSNVVDEQGYWRAFIEDTNLLKTWE